MPPRFYCSLIVLPAATITTLIWSHINKLVTQS